jgi:hydroxyacid-oxoacid transhydrogenase
METGAKTGIRDRALRPILGIIDPDHTNHCSPELTAFTGLDVLCHALESYTAVPYQKRGAAPQTPLQRPAYQVSFTNKDFCVEEELFKFVIIVIIIVIIIIIITSCIMIG